MTVVAVTAAGSALGRAVLERLDADRRVERIVGLGLDAPEMPVAKLDFRPMDVRDPLLRLAVQGVDVLVHLGPAVAGDASEATLFALAVNATRNVLDTAGRCGIPRVVLVSSGAVYGAHPDNPIPLTERAPRRANPDFAPAYHRQLAEELAEAWAEQHAAELVVLRPAVVLAADADTWVARHLESPRLPVVRGHEPPLQFVHIEDVAAAIALAVLDLEPGAYNAAADGWLSSSEVAAILGRRRVELPEEVAFAAARWLWRWRLLAGPPGLLHFTMHPWVLSSARLEASGWAPAYSNREVLREYAAAHGAWLSAGRLRVRRRDLYIGAFAGLGALLGLVFGGRRRVG